EAGIVIERAGPKGGFKRLAILAADTTSYADTAVAGVTAYRYRIRVLRGAPKLRPATAAVTTPAAIPGPDPDPGPLPGPGPGPVSSDVTENFSAGAGNFTPVDGTWEVASGAYRIANPSGVTTTHLGNRSVYNAPVSGDYTMTVDASVADTA